MKRALVCLTLLCLPALAQDRGIETDRESPVRLDLPEEDDAFVFGVFGDRTGGPDEGVKVLAQAVEDVNLVDPDLVMTVGDLIQGYNQTPDWMTQMREYRDIMGRLTAPWFPVAGNHDVYWRGDGRPEDEHDANYERHFGPLWYSFEHKGCCFIVLFTDESNPETGEKNFSKPECQQMSAEQFAFLDRTLTAAKDARHVFLFLHHPRWYEGNYGNDWRRVHARLADAGNVRAVFAGHIHRMVYDGPRDGIEYFTLATVGGGQSGVVPEAGYLHHWDLVTVRDGGISVATFPVGAALDPRAITRELSDEARRLADTRLSVEARPELSASGGVDGVYEFVLKNPVAHRVEADLSLTSADSRWGFFPDHGHAELGPGEERRFRVRAMRRPGELDGTLRLPEATINLALLTDEVRIHLPANQQELPLDLGSIAAPTPPENEIALDLVGGRDFIAIPHDQLALPDGPFTIEGWLKARSFGERVGLFCKTESSEFGVFVSGGSPHFITHLDGEYRTASSDGAVLSTGTWHHVAGVYDGAEVRLYVDGQLTGKARASGKRTLRAIPLILGADVASNGSATSPFDGVIDEVRLSTVARYAGDSVTIPRRHAPDEHTHLLLHLDHKLGPWIYDDSPRQRHPRWSGNPQLVPAD
ncbi:MAG: metallophosphoesterase [Planctomycetota bacterium]|nr:metallophosphoesterase [Planctomycetota bacterium]